MEALSVAANIVPIIATAAKVVKTLEKIARLRHAPPQLLQLLNEVRIEPSGYTFFKVSN